MKMAKRIGTATMVVMLLACASVSAVCYEQKWFNITQQCDGSCGYLYHECPTRVLCDLGATARSTGPIAIGPVKCNSYVGGTGNCERGTCVNGTPVPSRLTVNVPKQDCKGNC
jgi:hypothetical protein